MTQTPQFQRFTTQPLEAVAQQQPSQEQTAPQPELSAIPESVTAFEDVVKRIYDIFVPASSRDPFHSFLSQRFALHRRFYVPTKPQPERPLLNGVLHP
jgi:hypothetical protein